MPLLHGAVLLEMKYHVSLPAVLRDLLPMLPAQPTRVSKYRRCVHMCGLAAPDILKQAKLGDQEAKLNGLLQELAWDAVVQHPLSGVRAE